MQLYYYFFNCFMHKHCRNILCLFVFHSVRELWHAEGGYKKQIAVWILTRAPVDAVNVTLQPLITLILTIRMVLNVGPITLPLIRKVKWPKKTEDCVFRIRVSNCNFKLQCAFFHQLFYFSLKLKVRMTFLIIRGFLLLCVHVVNFVDDLQPLRAEVSWQLS